MASTSCSRTPTKLAELRRRPDEVIDTCVEELLRVTSPAHTSSPLHALEPIEINGITIPAGDMLLPGLMAANHDPSRISDPASLDISRRDNPHIAFGHGILLRLGAQLARLEARVALPALFARFPGLRLAVPADTVTWHPSPAIHAQRHFRSPCSEPGPGAAEARPGASTRATRSARLQDLCGAPIAVLKDAKSSPLSGAFRASPVLLS
jgi:cytochrome P450